MGRRHGTVSCYTGGCRRDECRAAQSAKRDYYRRQQAYGRPTSQLIDAEPVRAHVLQQLEAGVGYHYIAKRSRVSVSVVRRLLYGYPAPNARPMKRIKGTAALSLMAFTVATEELPGHTSVDAAGTRRRALAMARLGYPLSWQARRMGLEHSQFKKAVWAGRVSARTARLVRALYDELWDRPALASGVATRSSRWAESVGGLLPLQLDDELLDLSDADLEAELARQVDLMDDDELRRCTSAYRNEGERSPLIVAAAREWRRRLADAPAAAA